MERHWLTPFGWGSSSSLRRSDVDPFSALQREVGRLFDEVGRGLGPLAATGGAVAPRLDIKETDSEICILAELPGVEQKDIEVTLAGDVLTIQGEKRAEATHAPNENWHVMERSYGSFARAVHLPFAAKPDELQASFKDGVLRITLAKTAAGNERAQRIPIGSSGTGSAPAANQPGASSGEAGTGQSSTAANQSEAQRRAAE
jgi:HSP20 family protein